MMDMTIILLLYFSDLFFRLIYISRIFCIKILWFNTLKIQLYSQNKKFITESFFYSIEAILYITCMRSYSSFIYVLNV